MEKKAGSWREAKRKERRVMEMASMTERDKMIVTVRVRERERKRQR